MIMKRTRKDEAPVNKVISSSDKKLNEPRILRRSKRKIVQANLKSRVLSSCKNSPKVGFSVPNSNSSDVSDCIVINEIIPQRYSPLYPKSSTPISNARLHTSRFQNEMSPISKLDELDQSSDVIVISDESLPAVIPTIEISDDDRVESTLNKDFEILPTLQNFNGTEKNNPDKSVEPDNICSKLSFPNCNSVMKQLSRIPAITRLFHSPYLRRKKTRGLYNWHHSKRRVLTLQDVPLENLKNQNNCENHAHIDENIFIGSPISLPKSGLRPIIIDGSNVAFHHSNNSYFSCKGLEICIKYFKLKGHHVTAFVPQFRMQKNKSDDPRLLNQLVRKGDVILTPSRIIDGNPIVSYDDRYIVQTAVLKGGVIVSRDNYRDLLTENPAWADTIKYRLLQFTWVQDLLIFPKDPLGNNGPSLEEFLKFG